LKFHNETDRGLVALLGIGLLEGSGDLHAGNKSPGVPLKQRPVVTVRGQCRTLKSTGKIQPRMVVSLYSKQESPRSTELSTRRNSNTKMPLASEVVALHLDFVAKPEGAGELNRGLGLILNRAGLAQEGLESALLLVSDREARLVTLLTFWDASRFATGREQRIAWMQKLLAAFADGPVRAQTSTPQFVLAEQTTETELNKSVFAGAAELAQVAG
jgi:hypothetical protein